MINKCASHLHSHHFAGSHISFFIYFDYLNSIMENAWENELLFKLAHKLFIFDTKEIVHKDTNLLA